MAMERHFIQEGIIRSEIETFLRKELEGAGYSSINIQKTPLATRVVLYVEKPPLVIGKKGRRINKLTRFLKEKYGIENPAIDVQTVENPNLDANIVARRIAQSLEKGMNRRRVVYKAVRAAMASGAQGIEVIVAGKIIGKGGRAKQEKYLQGYMRKVGDSAKLVRTGSTQSYMKAGVIGITVKIVPPDIVFPDQIELKTDKTAEITKEETTPVPEAKKAEAAAPEKAEILKPAAPPVKKKAVEKIGKKIGADEIVDIVVGNEETEEEPPGSLRQINTWNSIIISNMAILRNNEIRDLSTEELEDKLTQMQGDMMKIRGVLASGGIPEHVGQLRETRRTIARIQTYKNDQAKTASKKDQKPGATQKK